MTETSLDHIEIEFAKLFDAEIEHDNMMQEIAHIIFELMEYHVYYKKFDANTPEKRQQKLGMIEYIKSGLLGCIGVLDVFYPVSKNEDGSNGFDMGRKVDNKYLMQRVNIKKIVKTIPCLATYQPL